ncbi:putative 1,3-beta-glucanosyltransferase [Seiridium cardinale]
MLSLRSLAFLACIAAGIASAQETTAGTHDCGEINVFYTGLPSYHPLVVKQGWDPVEVDLGIIGDTRAMIEAGYNVKLVVAGPEQDIGMIRNALNGTRWDVTGVGYGVRPATIPEIVTRFEDLLQLFKEETPEARTVFNIGPTSLLWSVQRRFPLKSTCAARPGKYLVCLTKKHQGHEVFFDGYKGMSVKPKGDFEESSKDEL